MAALPPEHPRYFAAGVKRMKAPVDAKNTNPQLSEIKQASMRMAKLSASRIGHSMNLKNTPARAFRTMSRPGDFGLASLSELLQRQGIG